MYLKFGGKLRPPKFPEDESVVLTGAIDCEKQSPGGQVGNKTTKLPLRTGTPLQPDKTLYHYLRNLEKFPQALHAGRIRLLSLLDGTVSTALAAPPDGTSILLISEYSPSAVHDFFANTEETTVARFEAYLLRRRQDGGVKISPDLEYAKWWLRTAAPVKYVDRWHLPSFQCPPAWSTVAKDRMADSQRGGREW